MMGMQDCILVPLEGWLQSSPVIPIVGMVVTSRDGWEHWRCHFKAGIPRNQTLLFSRWLEKPSGSPRSWDETCQQQENRTTSDQLDRSLCSPYLWLRFTGH
ncbi:uncharacterized protein LOC112495131 isoform X2 [Cephus cinctus]|uniref:Uncharacterized protein LOC112495131 isoform X2 n=1 Tax=Cephus cinctus TaxID=211228 RepID=A0AAJ7RSU8_CEPCN|nr:uncharacterized protein LOC112495131 isoform X2 [Cephus cinctus]